MTLADELWYLSDKPFNWYSLNANEHRLQLRELSDRAEALERDIHAYRGALGYAVPGYHDGKLADGTTPRCGLCEAKERDAARYRWMRMPPKSAGVVVNYCIGHDWYTVTELDELDSVIDAAMKDIHG